MNADEQGKQERTPEAQPGSAEPRAGAQADKPEAESASPERDRKAQEGQRPEDPESADDVMNRRKPGHEEADAAVLADSRRHTRRSFVLAAAGAAAGYGLWHYSERPNPSDDMQPTALRRAFQLNADLSRGLTRDHALAPTYPLSKAENLRINGIYGLKKAIVIDTYRVQLVGARDAQAGHARYTPDVTKWQYTYMAADSHEDQGHDTKVDPAKEKQLGAPAAPAAPAAKPQAAGNQAEPAAKPQPPANQPMPEPRPGPSGNTAEKMTPAPMVHHAMKMQDDDDDDDNERGQEQAGESDSTLKPGTPGLLLTLDDIKRLPRHELVTQFKCIEGWSQIVHWAGVRMADFLEAYPPAKINGRDPRYVYMETPNGDYYVGYDMEVCRHPQTLLVTEMMGQPLTQNHGAPLRIHMPTKYGYKQIKRIGLIAYMDEKPDDYWTKLGYDWYAGL